MSCPICERPTISNYKPFCSRRCGNLDLQRWLTGRYAVPVEDDEISDTDFPDG